jgi:hypothetical protein
MQQWKLQPSQNYFNLIWNGTSINNLEFWPGDLSMPRNFVSKTFNFFYIGNGHETYSQTGNVFTTSLFGIAKTSSNASLYNLYKTTLGKGLGLP